MSHSFKTDVGEDNILDLFYLLSSERVLHKCDLTNEIIISPLGKISNNFEKFYFTQKQSCDLYYSLKSA
jgi:hypothetical protein